MRKVWLMAIMLALPLAGCAESGDDAPASSEPPTKPARPKPGEAAGYDWTPPAHPLPDVVTGMEFLSLADENRTTGVWIEDGRAYLSGGSGLRIFDVRDPANPYLLAADIENTTGTRDVDVMKHPNGKLYAVLAHGGARMTFVDVTDPFLPFVVQQVTNLGSVHNLAVVPNTTVVYNSISINTQLGPQNGHLDSTGRIDIVDFADPENPTVTPFWFPAVIIDPMGKPRQISSTTCHDMTFNVELKRAYCAGVTDTTIWDISDPRNPVIVQAIDWPGTNIHHGVWDARGGDLLILGDEFGGVATPSPPCSSLVRDPTSALWFFDISDLGNPLPVGYFQIQHDQISTENPGAWPYCSTHFGQVVEDRDLLVMGWYSAGTVLVDFSDTLMPRQVAHYYAPGTNTWEARYYNGHIYTGDTGRGMEILRLL